MFLNAKKAIRRVLAWVPGSMLWFATVLPGRADTHIYAGALGTNQNDQLFFAYAAPYDAALTQHAFPQVLRTNGLNAGYFRGDVLTFTALAATRANSGPAIGHAAPGSRLAVEVVEVRGPEGGGFQFWEGDGEDSLGEITFQVPVRTTHGTNRIVISGHTGGATADPFGHIHGRQFTTSAPGMYLVGFRVIDVSTHGAGGGPIHAPSELLFLRFQAGLRVENIRPLADRVTVSFRSPPGISNLLERAGAAAGEWAPAAAPVRGNNTLQSFADLEAPAGQRFYRIRQLNNLP